ncbi:MAG: hypothetical protein KKF30_07405 [Proteobacteria bacterium]|nr:hypothetical protein [Pseudomonadota bacterium]MBU4470306.1 hypothetical protein [Pseudomonadota bacterium]MCG2752718.1 hypothetical protein [Desulfobacteraceae bacterium]
MPKFNHQNFGDIQKYVYLIARVLSVNGADDTVGLSFRDTTLVASGVPIFFHCAMNSVQRENGALVGSSGAFREEDSVIVRCRLDDAGATITPVCVVARDQGPRSCCEWVEEFGATICANHTWRVPYIIPYYELNPPGDDGWLWPCHSLPFYRYRTFGIGGVGVFLINIDCDIVSGGFHLLNYVEVLRESGLFFENYPYGLYWKAGDNPGNLPQRDGILKFKFSDISAEVYAGDGSIPYVDFLSARNFIYIWWEAGEQLIIYLPRAKNDHANYPILPPEMDGRVIDATGYVNGQEFSVDLSEYWDISMGEIDRILVGSEAFAEQPLDPWGGGVGDEITLWAKSEFTLDYIKICST